MKKLPIDLPLSDDDLSGRTTCGSSGCTAMVKQSQSVIGCIQVGTITHQGYFCSFDCRNTWRDTMRPGVLYREF